MVILYFIFFNHQEFSFTVTFTLNIASCNRRNVHIYAVDRNVPEPQNAGDKVSGPKRSTAACDAAPGNEAVMNEAKTRDGLAGSKDMVIAYSTVPGSITRFPPVFSVETCCDSRS
jgi:hypothetical protein